MNRARSQTSARRFHLCVSLLWVWMAKQSRQNTRPALRETHTMPFLISEEYQRMLWVLRDPRFVFRDP